MAPKNGSPIAVTTRGEFYKILIKTVISNGILLRSERFVTLKKEKKETNLLYDCEISQVGRNLVRKVQIPFELYETIK